MEMYNLVRDYGQRGARQKWIELYGDAKVPSKSTFGRILKKVQENNSVENQVSLTIPYYTVESG